MHDWNDHRLILAIVRGGNLARAATRLGLNHSTVFRRLRALESRLGTRLFERSPDGQYRPNEIGARAAAAAERMEEAAAELSRDIARRDERVAGLLRITCSETLAHRLLPRWIAQLRVDHPDLIVEILAENRILDLTRREADVAIRADRPSEAALRGRKLATVAKTVYGARRYLDSVPALPGPEALAGHPLIGWDQRSTGLNSATWLAAVAPPSAVVYRSNGYLNQLAAACAGVGLAVLPCYLADPEPQLVRALPGGPIPELAREMWLVTHADLSGSAMVGAFFAAVTAGVRADRGLLEGYGEGAAAIL